MPVEKIDVIEVNELELTRKTLEELMELYEVVNDGYYRYYLVREPNGVREEVNAALRRVGIMFPEEASHKHVLLHFWW